MNLSTSWSNDTDGLSLNVGHLAIVVEGDLTGHRSGPGSWDVPNLKLDLAPGALRLEDKVAKPSRMCRLPVGIAGVLLHRATAPMTQPSVYLPGSWLSSVKV